MRSVRTDFDWCNNAAPRLTAQLFEWGRSRQIGGTLRRSPGLDPSDWRVPRRKKPTSAHDHETIRKIYIDPDAQSQPAESISGEELIIKFASWEGRHRLLKSLSRGLEPPTSEHLILLKDLLARVLELHTFWPKMKKHDGLAHRYIEILEQADSLREYAKKFL